MQDHLCIRLLTGILLLFIIAGCKKTGTPEKEVELKGIFKSANVVELSVPVMYTVNGQVNNQDVIQKHLEKHSFAGYFNLSSTTETFDNDGLEINFNGNEADLSRVFDGSVYTDKYNVTEKTSSGFILQAADTIRMPTSFSNRHNSQMLLQYANKITHFSNCHPISPTTGYTDECTFRNKMPFVIKNDLIYVSVFSIAASTYSAGGTVWSYMANQNVIGIFNTSISGMMETGDTIVVQNKIPPLNKQ